MNLFKGKLGRDYFYRRSYSDQMLYRDLFDWATSVKPGDLVNCCDYWNRVVKSVEHFFATVGFDHDFGFGIQEFVVNPDGHSNIIWFETVFHFTDGSRHSSHGGCAVPFWTMNQVKKHHSDCDESGCNSTTKYLETLP